VQQTGFSMSLNARIFLAYFAILGVAFYLILNVFMSELKPGVRQSTEDTLIDMSNLLAEVVKDDLLRDNLSNSDFKQNINAFLARSYRAKIYTIEKYSSSIRIYITDNEGIVKFDSANIGLGEDYSQWNDVYLTLKGQYGARSTAYSPDDATTTVMHVAAPIIHKGVIIGSLTVAKANMSLQPFIEMAQTKIQTRGILLVLLSVLAAIIISYWLTVSIRKLTKYADKIAAGESVPVPRLKETELVKLSSSIDNMRQQLAGKEYVEKYVYALTHELKSPVSAIKGAAEIIGQDIPQADRNRFVDNIQSEVERIDEMINRLLALTQLEKCETLTKIKAVKIKEIVEKVLASKALQLQKKSLQIQTQFSGADQFKGDEFLLTQAVDNLVQNAIEFSAEKGKISVTVNSDKGLSITVKDWGKGIPNYAIDRIFDRFYSLPRPVTQKKSSGLGLCFVKQICVLHLGSVSLKNHSEGGVQAVMTLPD
jgi:two-component system sensor histidine kinase CreC